MTTRKRTVAVMQLPEIKRAKHRQAFLLDLQRCIDAERPLIVLDCSSISQLDRQGVHLLLCCLEETMKRNGDLKLAGLNSSAEAVLENCGAYRLFDVHATTASAVSSFHSVVPGGTSRPPVTMESRTQPESAA